MRKQVERGHHGNVLFIASLPQPGFLPPEPLEPLAKLLERPRDVPVLRAALEAQRLRALALEERELDVVGEEVELVRVRHFCLLSLRLLAIRVSFVFSPSSGRPDSVREFDDGGTLRWVVGVGARFACRGCFCSWNGKVGRRGVGCDSSVVGGGLEWSGVEATLGPADCGVSCAEVESGIVDYIINPRIMGG